MKDSSSPRVSPHVRRIRAFVAVNLPVATINKVGEVQAELRTRARQAALKVGWVSLPNMHVTLKFLAEIPEESVWAVRDRLTERLRGRAGLQLHLRGVGAFPAAERPRVLWVGIHSEGDGLSRLAADVDHWLEELGFTPEKRPFSPHLTLGRVKAGAADILEGLDQVDLGECPVSEVVVYQSVLKRDGAEYTPLATISLQPALRSAAPAAEPPRSTENQTETE